MMALVEEVQARTAELLDVKRQVAEAEALHHHLRSQLAAREQGTVATEPEAAQAQPQPQAQPPAVERQAVEATV